MGSVPFADHEWYIMRCIPEERKGCDAAINPELKTKISRKWRTMKKLNDSILDRFLCVCDKHYHKNVNYILREQLTGILLEISQSNTEFSDGDNTTLTLSKTFWQNQKQKISTLDIIWINDTAKEMDKWSRLTSKAWQWWPFWTTNTLLLTGVYWNRLSFNLRLQRHQRFSKVLRRAQ